MSSSSPVAAHLQRALIEVQFALGELATRPPSGRGDEAEPPLDPEGLYVLHLIRRLLDSLQPAPPSQREAA